MIIYLAVLVASVILGNRLQTASGILQPKRKKFKTVFYYVLLVIILGGIAGYRKFVGTDYQTYIDIYTVDSRLPWSKIFSQGEIIYGVLNKLFFQMFNDYVPLFALIGFFTAFLIVRGIRELSSCYWFSFYLFVTGMYYFDMLNCMRQLVSTAIMFAAFPLVKKRKWTWVIVLTIIATGFHASSALMLIVFLYAANVKPWSMPTWIIGGIAAFIFVFYTGFINSALDFLTSIGNRYATYEDMLTSEGAGANVLRFLFTFLPVAVSWYVWPVLKKRNPHMGILVNISFINSMFMLVAMRHNLFARYCLFFGVYNTILWPEIIYCFNKKSRKIIVPAVMSVFFVYFYLIVHTDGNLLPYSSWLFGGTYA